MKEIELKIPNLGEAEDTEIIEISVKKGDKLSKNDPIIVLESEKAAMEVPSDFDGKIKDIKVKEGDSVREGTVFAVLEVEDNEESKQEKDEIKVSSTETSPIEDKSQRTEKASIDFSGINAGPAVRKIARELEIDLTKIIGSGKNKMITKDDLKNFIHSNSSIQKIEYADLKSLEVFGDYEIENQSKIRKAGAKNLTQSWQSIPHVSHFEEAEITKIEKQRKDLNEISAIKITPLAYIIKATSLALEEFPLMNSSLVDDGKLMVKKYINIGVAVNTDQGLVVPVIKDVNNMKIGKIAESILEISIKARDKKLMKEDITGSTFTISSLGGIGGTGFSPIINPPEVGIIGVSRTRKVAKIENGSPVDTTILPFSLSYDHRVINGVDAGNFMTFIKATIEKGL
ncbi:MAG: 2-oxo acid dehydrogenase subunit E2 [Gammaproteobacteria bacterium]